MTRDTPRALRVFVNAIGVDVPIGSSALDAVRQWNADEAARVGRGERIITDSRGLPIAPDVTVSAGSIFRIIPARHVKKTTDAGLDSEEA
jgi:hypothetical protein